MLRTTQRRALRHQQEQPQSYEPTPHCHLTEIKTNFGRLDLISWQSQGAAGKTKIQEGTEPPEFARKSKPTLRAKLVLISWQRQHHHTEIKTSFLFLVVAPVACVLLYFPHDTVRKSKPVPSAIPDNVSNHLTGTEIKTGCSFLLP